MNSIYNRRLLTVAILLLSLSISGQIKYSSNGISFSLPSEFKSTTSRGSEFATFNRDNNLQIAFANGCNTIIQKKQPSDKNLESDICFEIQFAKIKTGLNPNWVLKPKDTTISKYPCNWGEFHFKIKEQNYYTILVLVKGKKYFYEILFSGFLENKINDMKIFNKVITSYKEKKKQG